MQYITMSYMLMIQVINISRVSNIVGVYSDNITMIIMLYHIYLTYDTMIQHGYHGTAVIVSILLMCYIRNNYGE